MYQTLLTDLTDGILTITINRESKLNALNRTVLSELDQAFGQYAAESAVKGIIITGAGQKAFVAGADIAEFADYNAEQGQMLAQKGHDIFNRIEQCPKPVIAAVNGFALGGGCELAMACHLRVASSNAKFGQPEVNLGIIPGYGGTQRLPQLVGKGRAFELLMTADTIGAQEAHRIGLVNQVVEPENLLVRCAEIIQKIASKAPLAIAKIVDAVVAAYDNNTNGFEREIALFAECVGTNDFKEGTKAFVEKRKANFQGN